MIIQCDQCDRKFRVDDTKIKPPGSRVRCSKCGNVFFVEKKDTPEPEQKTAETPKDDIQINVNANIGGQSAGNTEPPSPPESASGRDNAEKVWSIDDTNPDPVESKPTPSIDVGISEKPEIEEKAAPELKVDYSPSVQVEQEPASNDNLPLDIEKNSEGSLQVEPETEEKQSEESAFSWASLSTDDSAHKNKTAEADDNSLSSDDALTPPVEQPAFSTASDEAAQLQGLHQEPQAAQADSVKQDEGPSLSLDLDKAQEVDSQQAFQSAQQPSAQLDSSLSVDQNTMSEIQAESYASRAADNTTGHDSTVAKGGYQPQKKSTGSKIGSLITKLVALLSVLVILGSIGLILAVKLELLSKEKTKELRQFLVETLPIEIKNPLDDISISDVQAGWINSSNGPLYIVKGRVTNLSVNIVNYIQLKTEYINNGQVVYESTQYAGNTFTTKELQTVPLSEIKERLNRKNGDIDFSDPRKLAGTNYNLMPGDSIEFYSVFPSKSQILGLKHNIEISDAEMIIIENNSQ